MTNRRQIFDYRRQHPELFPFYCESCVPQRRFALPPHKAQHDKDKHGISIPIISISYPQEATYSALTLHPNPMSASATSSPLSTLSARELNTFVQNELEPDTEYNKSCNTVVDRLCQFMQNNFPDQLRPSEVRKVNIILWFFFVQMKNHMPFQGEITESFQKPACIARKCFAAFCSYYYFMNKEIIILAEVSTRKHVHVYVIQVLEKQISATFFVEWFTGKRNSS